MDVGWRLDPEMQETFSHAVGQGEIIKKNKLKGSLK